jgi:hypothetical protein
VSEKSSSSDEDEFDNERAPLFGLHSESSSSGSDESPRPKRGSGMETEGSAGAPPKAPPKRAPKAAEPPKLHYLGARTKCKWCPAMLWPTEKKGVTKCCGSGKYVLFCSVLYLEPSVPDQPLPSSYFRARVLRLISTPASPLGSRFCVRCPHFRRF